MPELFTTDEAAKKLKIHKNTLLRYISEGRITAYNIAGSGFRIREEDLTNYLESCKIQTKVGEVK